MATRRRPAGLNPVRGGLLLDRFVAHGSAGTVDMLRSRVLVGASFTLFSITLLLGMTRLVLGGPQRQLAPILLTAAAVYFAAPFVLRRTHSRQIAGGIVVGLSTAILLALAWREGGVNAPAVIWFPILPVLAGYLMGLRASILTAVLLVVGIVSVNAAQPDAAAVAGSENGARTLKLVSASLAAAFGAALSWLFEIGRKRYVAALYESESKAESMIAAMPDAIFIVGRDGGIESARIPATPEAASLAQIASKGSEDLYSLLGQEHEERLKKQIDEASEHHSVEIYDLPLDDRHHFFELRLAAAGGPMLLALLRDVTREHEVDRMKEEFLSIVSHELRTPLTAVRGALGIIEGSLRDSLPENAGKLVDVANRNTERLADLVNDLLDLRQVESGKMTFTPEIVPVGELLHASRKLNTAFALTYGVTLDVSENFPDARVNVDKARMQQVLTNLVSNAVKHSSDGLSVRLGCSVRDDQAVFSVEDDGVGIPERFRNYVFDKFSQADSSDTRTQAGTGLGLSISREFVNEMGGQIWFESKKGDGTVFFVSFPAV